jgi:23S rRNA pseudouridine1911/1915/1917 synthase
MAFKPENIIYEDNHILVYNKQAGDIVQGDKTGDKPLSEVVKDYIKERDAKPGNVFLGVTHRIDRPTTGVVIFAKTSKALERMNELFRDGGVDKTYWAIVKKAPEKDEDLLVHHLSRNEKQNKSYVFDAPKSTTKEAKLRYKVISKSDNYSLIEVELLTGRHHQIRAQLASIGSPIKGDLKYGFPRSNPDGGICLHARKVEFIHPVKKEKITIVAPVPDDALWQYFAKAAEKGV